jgi:hypothetical protein
MTPRLGGLIVTIVVLATTFGSSAGDGTLAATTDAPQLPAPPATAATVGTDSTASADRQFTTEHIWDAKVTIANGIVLGKSKYGLRRIVPITGGSFEGPNIRGEVMPGGEDWQLYRPDGDTELYARYLLKTHDGHIIQVINRVLMHYPPKGDKGEPYVRSVIDLEAPLGSPYEYLNHAIFFGTLTQPALKPGETPYVMIGVYKLL